MNVKSSGPADQILFLGSGDGQRVKPTGECIIIGGSEELTSNEEPEGEHNSLITHGISPSVASEKDDKVLCSGKITVSLVSEEIVRC